MERKTITVKEFETKYGFTWRDILCLGWLKKNHKDAWYECVEHNDCPSYCFLFDGRPTPEVYEDTAPALAEILKLQKEVQKKNEGFWDDTIDIYCFHCFVDNYDSVCCVTGLGDNKEFKRFDLEKYYTY